MRNLHPGYSAIDRRRQIMQAAKGLFARRGFEGTTTRRIAERAHMNEAIIFRHFPHKQDLYWAIIEDQCRNKGGREEHPILFEATNDDRKVFGAIAEDILQRNTEDFTLSRLLLFTALENHGLSDRFFRTYVAEYFDLLAKHIRKRIRAGYFRRVHPLLAARGFLGMVTYHFLIQELFGGKRYQKFNPRKVSQTLTDIWLQGMMAGKGRGARARPASKHR